MADLPEASAPPKAMAPPGGVPQAGPGREPPDAGAAAPKAAAAAAPAAAPAGAPAAEPVPGALVGSVARIDGLKSLPELNGQLCYVLRPADSGGRVVARTSAGEKSLRPANLSCGLEACLPGRARTLGGALLALALASLADALRGGGALVPISMLAWLAFTLGFAWWLHRPSKAADAWLVSVSELSSCLPARTVYRIGFVIVSLHFAVSIRVYDSLLIGTLAPAPLPGAPLGATGAAGGAGAGGPESGAPGNGTEGGENMLLAAARRLQEPNGSARERMQLEGPWRSVRWGYVGAAGLAVQGAVPFDGSLSVPSALHLAGVGAFLSGAGQHCLLSAYVLGSSRGRRLLEAAPWLESVRELRSKAGQYGPLVLTVLPLSAQYLQGRRPPRPMGREGPSFKSIVRDSGMLKSMAAMQWMMTLLWAFYFSTLACDFWVASALL